MHDISCSIVLYHNPVHEIQRAVSSFLGSKLNIKLYLIDNSRDDSFRYIFNSPEVEYIYNGRNLGYGAAHNIAIQKITDTSKYHVILNPDVEFEPVILSRLFKFMQEHKDTGLIMPKVLYRNGDTQYLCKLIPAPTDLFIRRFIPGLVKKFFRKKMDNYELKNKDYDSILETPNLSGCFMFIRSEVFKQLGSFDERYFLYLEDTDLCRRINEYYRTLYYPSVCIIHGYSKASYKSLRLMKLHLLSSIKYFNKWGWFKDPKRDLINLSILNNSYMMRKSISIFENATVNLLDARRVNKKEKTNKLKGSNTMMSPIYTHSYKNSLISAD